MEELGPLVERAQRGDLDAYAEVVRRFQDMAFGYALAVLGDFHRAQDAAQEAFIDAYRRLDALRVPAAFPGWFRRIVFKHCDRLTRRRLPGLVSLESAAAVAASVPGPAEAAERREMRDAVLSAIRSLPERERAVTTLFYIDGYSQKDIAEFLEVPVTTVDGRLRTARKGLKQRMLSMFDETLKSFGLPERFSDVVAQMTFVIRRISPLADGLRALSGEQLRARTAALKRRLAGGEERDSVKAEAFALVSEASRRAWDMPLYDVQLVAGLILDQGWVAEMASGEGKTIACLPAAYMGVLEGKRVHVAVLSQSMARRDANLAGRVFSRLGVTVGCLASEQGGQKKDPRARRQAYAADITYGWNAGFGFDQLGDTLRAPDYEKVQGTLDLAIIDEVDTVLIDQARTPLIIAGRADSDPEQYRKADAIARELIGRSAALQGTDLYQVNPPGHKFDALLTAEGIAAAEELCGVGNFDSEPNARWTGLIQQALRAHLIYERDREYVIKDGGVMILDESTGRVNPGREWSDGLHQAVECKEGLEIRGARREEASAVMQDYFRSYAKLAGITGTAKAQAAWFREAYGMDVAVVPTRYPVNRVDHEDRVYSDVQARYEAVVEEVRHYSVDLERPVLVGTSGIHESQVLSDMLTRRGIRHQLLDARPENAPREGEIIAAAGRKEPPAGTPGKCVGAVTISANMAGRGTAIELGPGVVCASCKVPSPAAAARPDVGPEELFLPGVTKCCIDCTEYEEASGCAHCFKPKVDPDFPRRGRTACREEPPCGLHVVGTCRAQVRRLDDQLRARAGRQGEPGSSRFFVSLEDELLQSELEEPEIQTCRACLDSGAVSGPGISAAIERAQSRVERRHFEVMRAQDLAERRRGSSEGP